MSVQTILAPTTLFYAYAHEDEALCKHLELHLSSLHREGLLASWHDRDILPGADWAGDIDEHLNSAHIILLLVSASFLASDYCYDLEMQHALQRHRRGEAHVIPIILRPCDWSGAPFAKLRVLPLNAKPITSWDDQDEAFTQIAQQLRLLLGKKSPTFSTSVPLVLHNSKPKPFLLFAIGSLLLLTCICIGIWFSLSHRYLFTSALLSTVTPAPTYTQLKDQYSGIATGSANATITFSREGKVSPQGQVKMQVVFQIDATGNRSIYECSGQVSQDNKLTLSCIETGASTFLLSINGTIFADGHMEGQLTATDTSDSTYNHKYRWFVTPPFSQLLAPLGKYALVPFEQKWTI